MPKFSERSKKRLATCHQDLQELFNEVIKHTDCSILCGHRGKKAQEDAFNAGNSKAHFGQSPHNSKPSMAVDAVPYPLDWNKVEDFYHLAGIVKGIASQMNINIKWGGDFNSFFDAPHYELRS